MNPDESPKTHTPGSERATRLQWKRTIGIVGGLGPHSHIELERLILQATAERLHRPPNDQDYPEWILSAIPSTPDRTAAILGESPSPLDWLERSVRRLAGTEETRRADFAIIACNTAHAYLDELRRRSPIPVVDVIGETVREAKHRTAEGATIGVMATTGTLRMGLYANALSRVEGSMSAVSLLDCHDDGLDGEALQERLTMEPIYGPLQDGKRQGGGIKSGVFHSNAQRAALSRAVGILKERGASLVVLGCTEIPLVLGRESSDGVPVLDPLQVAADVAVELALGRRPLP